MALENTEKALSYWIDEMTSRNVVVTTRIIQQKALEFYSKYCGKDEFDFKASNGWFEKFKKRSSLHNIKFSGEASSADKISADQFLPVIEDIIKNGGYSMDQVFNADETGLFWKRSPSRTFMTKSQLTSSGIIVSLSATQDLDAEQLRDVSCFRL